MSSENLKRNRSLESPQTLAKFPKIENDQVDNEENITEKIENPKINDVRRLRERITSGSIRAIPSVEMNPQSQNDDQAYLAKIQHLSKYIEPLKKMITRIGNKEQEKLGKMKKLMDILSNPTKEEVFYNVRK